MRSTLPDSPATSGKGIRSGSNNSGSNILSDKVNRALEVRTDTPAMMAALEALANLSEHSSGISSSSSLSKASFSRVGSGGGIDARSVRVAIERDALQQALLFQEELKKLVNTVKEVRSSISDIAGAASKVSSVIESNVVRSTVGADGSSVLALSAATKAALASSGSSGGINIEGSAGESKDDNMGYGAKNPYEEERKLALILHDAFRARDEAAKRSEAVHTFLDKFDLSESDSFLLDHYNFDEFDQHYQQDPSMGMADGMAFLDALERVRSIRVQLGKTFGTDVGLSSASSKGNTSSFSGRSSFMSNDSNRSSSALGATSALRIMDGLATKQERAYERLYHFLQRHLNLSASSVAHVPTSSSQQRQSMSSYNPHMQLDDDEIDEALTHPLVQRSMSVLRHMPAYYAHTLELIAASRRSEVTRRFLLALTSGYNGLSPIEMRAHDPVNYVGDMCAFVFRAASGESDLAWGVLSYENEKKKDEEGEGVDEAQNEEGNKEDIDELMDDEDDDLALDLKPMSAADMLSHAVSGVSRPLKSRISQVVSSLACRPDENEEGDDFEGGTDAGSGFPKGGRSDFGIEGSAIEEEATAARSRISSLYSVCGLLLFYHSALTKAIQKLDQRQQKMQGKPPRPHDDLTLLSKNSLLQSIIECLEEGALAFAASVRVYGAMLEPLASLTSSDKESTLAKALVVTITDARLASPGFSSDVVCRSSDASKRSLSLEYLCDVVIESAMPYCRTLDDASSLRSALTTAKKAGLEIECSTKWDKAMSDQEKVILDRLIETETKRFLDQCGLGRLITSLEDMEHVYVDGMTMSSHPGLTKADVESAMKEFYSSLFAPPLPSFESVRDPMLRKRSRGTIATNVSNEYARLYDMITGERGGYNDLSFLGHNPNQVRTLLSL
mmetsp:Transcript_55303/g.82263  ORF Transcript_55303/g.82263 Transcript_55303/m.82263 type:complete len:902 (-) Transcript_55303:243-2948(-)